MSKNAGMIYISRGTLEEMLELPPGHFVHNIDYSFDRDAIAVSITGPLMPVVEDGCMIPAVSTKKRLVGISLDVGGE